MNKELKEENKEIKDGEIEEVKDKPKMRKIVIETDGTNITVSKLEVAGVLEYKAILMALLEKIK